MFLFTCISIFIFILGACIGSFLSVLIHRIQTNTAGIIAGHSECPQCKTNLRRRDLIPLVSYIWLRGKCHFCHHSIPATYPLLELMTGLVLLALYWKFPFVVGESFDSTSVQFSLLGFFVWYAVIAVIGIAIFWYDLQTQQIPTVFLWVLLGVSMVGRFLLFPLAWLELGLAVMTASVFFGGQYLLSRGRWLGSGDVYLAVAMAFIVGWPLILATISLSYIIGSLVCLPLLIGRKITKDMAIAFGPFLIIGLFLTLFFGEQIIAFYQGSFWI